MPHPVFSNSARFSVYKGASHNIKTVDVSNIKTIILSYQIFNNTYYTLTTLYYSSFCGARLKVLSINKFCNKSYNGKDVNVIVLIIGLVVYLIV